MPSAPALPFSAGPVRFRGLVEHRGFRLKRYCIELPGEPFAEARFRAGRGLALSAVPEPAVTPERPGVGFVIEHQGRDLDHVVIAWWDRRCELPVRIMVGDEGGWRPARDSESFCAHDLELVAAERDACVATLLGPDGPDAEGYLARVFPGAAR